jgi:hypothetical protein
LGEFLRAPRTRLSAAGLGLRREEVAQRCGLSVTGYTRLEPAGAGARVYEQIAFTLASRIDLKLVMLIGR